VIRTLFGGLGAAAMLLVASCSSHTDFQANARESIDQYGESSGFGKLSPTCDQPPSGEVGTVFDCTAETSDGATIRFQARIGDSKHVAVQPMNVLTPESLTKLESEAARILHDKTGVDVTGTDIDCGSQSRVAEKGEPIVCALNDLADGAIYDVSITPNDLANLSELVVEVAATPRP
jgi:hypothetical protein